MSDPTLNVQLLIDNVFRIIMPSESGRHHFRIKGISERWIGPPAWYLWFDDLPGSFLLEIREACMFPAGTVPGDQAPGKPSLSRGILGIKYYPDMMDKKAFQAFSHAEREIRISNCFDETGTPAFDHISHIPDTFFDIGAMEIWVAEGRRFAVLSLHAPSVWRVYKIDKGTTSASFPVLKGALDRDIPAWSWSWFLFDRLLATFCFVYKGIPLYVDLMEQEGEVFVSDHENHATVQGDPNVILRSLMGGFMIPDELFAAREEDRDHLFDLRQQLLNAARLAQARHVLACINAPREPIPWINPIWWRLNENHLTLDDTRFC